MTLSAELSVYEMSKLYESMIRISDLLKTEGIDDLFSNRDIDMKSIKIYQRVGTFTIDVEPDFLIWFVNLIARNIQTNRALITILTNPENSKWIHKPEVKNNVCDCIEVPLVFDV